LISSNRPKKKKCYQCRISKIQLEVGLTRMYIHAAVKVPSMLCSSVMFTCTHWMEPPLLFAKVRCFQGRLSLYDFKEQINILLQLFSRYYKQEKKIWYLKYRIYTKILFQIFRSRCCKKAWSNTWNEALA
jgi:hypothetical protein